MRLDQALQARGLAPTRAIAQRMISEGAARVNGAVVRRAATPVTDEDALELTAAPRFVSRGGDKLEAALRRWPIHVEGRVCLDIGAGTGGFTDCLLARGAARVYALDVGHDQLHAKLVDDARVVAREGINCRHLTPDEVGEPVALAVLDVSFISLSLVLPAVSACVQPGGDLIALVKPQFECGPEAAERGRGVITDPKLHQEALNRVRRAANAIGLIWRESLPSPLKGSDGNQEFLVWLNTAEAL